MRLITFILAIIFATACTKQPPIPKKVCANVIMMSTQYREKDNQANTIFRITVTPLGTVCGRDLDSIKANQHQHAVLCIDGTYNDIDYIINPI